MGGGRPWAGLVVVRRWYAMLAAAINHDAGCRVLGGQVLVLMLVERRREGPDEGGHGRGPARISSSSSAGKDLELKLESSIRLADSPPIIHSHSVTMTVPDRVHAHL